MVDKELLSKCLNTLMDVCSSKNARETVETLLKIHRNILYNEEKIQYRKIRVENPAFNQKVWSVLPARQFINVCGWLKIDDVVVFNSDENLLEIIDVLLEHRDIIPLESEWKEETELKVKSEAQIRDEELRRRAAIERQKELDEYMKDKKYREELAKEIKSQIIADKQRRKEIFSEPVVGNKLVKGAKIRTLNSPSGSAKRGDV